ncbi:MAG: hypothetical protein ACKOWQ_01515 [Aquirufa sp.]
MKNTLSNIEGVNFMNEKEMLDTFGGGWWSDFKDGFNAGWKWSIKAIHDVKDALKDIFGK